MSEIESNPDLLPRLRSLVGRNSRILQSGVSLGTHGTLRFMCFVELLSAAHVDQDLEFMGDCLAGLIRAEFPEGGPQVIAAPKRGNPLLGYRVAATLGMKSLFVRDEVLASRSTEGYCDKDEKVVLVDDVSSDGDLLCDAVGGLREAGLDVRCAFTIVDRSDGNAMKRLNSEGVSLKSALSLNDSDIDKLINADRAGALPRF